MGSRISWYAGGNEGPLTFSSDTMPFVDITSTVMEINIPDNCKYRDLKDQRCTIPLLVKTKEYDFMEAQKLAFQEIQKQQKCLSYAGT